MSHIHIKLEDVSFAYDGQPVLQNITFTAHENDAIGLIGANGVGKSTLLKLLVGLIDGFSGQIRVEELPVTKKMLPKIRERIGYVFQDSDAQLFMSTVEDDLAFAPRNYGLAEEEVQARVAQALEAVGIEHLRHRPIYKLSGGEKKLASIATILTLNPHILLMDEPSVALDPKNRRRLITLLNQFDHLKIIATHDLDLVLDTCTRTILLHDGRILADGPTREILMNKTLLEEANLELPLTLQIEQI